LFRIYEQLFPNWHIYLLFKNNNNNRVHNQETSNMNKEMINNLSTLVGRALIAIVFIMAGYSKIGGYEGTQGYMESVGVPGLLLPAVIALELLGGIAVLVGYHTRIAALLLGGFSFLAAILFHSDFAQQMQLILFTKNVAISGAFLLLFVHGPGQWAVKSRN